MRRIDRVLASNPTIDNDFAHGSIVMGFEVRLLEFVNRMLALRAEEQDDRAVEERIWQAMNQDNISSTGGTTAVETLDKRHTVTGNIENTMRSHFLISFFQNQSSVSTKCRIQSNDFP
ncbi:hypothetical protein N7517_004709 [Penicillium concentricum]|uniref:Uncharacterized protein n=1 Tax=Penicillium concentricum TaxID=293559 RepID=A0A9W9SAR3_9EURO|nr:uncharacterized protein N7517_004709 [Penicillium concentricum]KAJ5372703.1 hypothetical protein N7517_004709 [Penicillium concentricum]